MKKKQGIWLFSYRGIDVRLDYSWFLIVGLIVVTLGSYYFPSRYPDIDPFARWSISVASALLLFLSVLLHEFAHSITAQKLGIDIDGIVLFLFGGVAQMKSDPSNPKDEFYVAAAGPLCSLLIGLVLLGAYYALEQQEAEALLAMLWYLGELNLALVVFNMLPGFPLDGGRVARAAIWHFTDDIRRATKIVSNIGKLIAYTISGLGLLSFLGGAWAQGVIFIFLGMFLQQAADQGYQMVALKEGLSGITLGQIMSKDPHCVSPSLTVQELVDDYFYQFRVHSFPVIEKESSQLLGHITAKQIRSISRDQWADRTVEEVMTPVEELPLLNAEQDAYSVLQQMLQNGFGRLPVVNQNRKIVGIVTRKDIFEYVHMREEIEGDKSNTLNLKE